jgi:hypothetical protein
MGILHEDQYIFLITCDSVLFKMRSVSDKRCTENRNTHFMFNNIFFFENCAFNLITWKNTVDPYRPQMTIRRMSLTRWIPNATNTHSEYVTFITFPQQQWLQQRASTSRYTYVAPLVINASIRIQMYEYISRSFDPVLHQEMLKCSST